MKKVLLIVWVLLVFVRLNTNAQSASSVIKAVKIKDVKAMMDTSTLPMIVNFWATWCGPCVREIPYFDSLIAAKKRPVKFLLVSLDFAPSYPKEIAAFVKKQGYKGEVVFLNEFNADYFCPVIDKNWTGAIPVSVFINNAKNYRQFYGDQLTRERLAIEYEKLF
jgi:thiol-disulfide isomerase/thioredoxin